MFFFAKTLGKVFNGYTACFNIFAVWLFIFAFDFKPFKEKLKICVPGTKTSFKPVAQNTNLIKGKQVWNVFFVIGEIFVKGFFNFDYGILKFNKNKWKTVYKNNYIRTPPVILPLNPHLRNCSKNVVLRIFKINELDKIKSLFAILLELNLASIANQIVIIVIGLYHVAAGKVTAQIADDRINIFGRNIRINFVESLFYNFWQNTLFFRSAASSVV